MEFQPFQKIPRLFRPVVVTEKIDGTNASVYIDHVQGFDNSGTAPACALAEQDGMFMCAGSRTRWIMPESDNFGFARWVQQNASELFKLGPGHHFGEWWGVGIQRGYDLSERRFSLFNASKWNSDLNEEIGSDTKCYEVPCCHVVPVLSRMTEFDTTIIKDAMGHLANTGSFAALGYPNPEGVVVYHVAGNLLFKATLDNDGTPKGKVDA